MKRVNKKAIVAMLVTMIMSLGVMSGVNSRKTSDSNLQQASLVCTYAAGAGEIGDEVYTDKQKGEMAVSSVVLMGAAKSLAGCAVGLGWCPAGWIAGVGAGVAGL
jgi:hypothetical protein